MYIRMYVYIRVYIRHRASGTEWSAPRLLQLRCRLRILIESY